MRVDNRGFTTHYQTSGSGEPVVLLADLFEDASSWVAAGYVGALAPTNRLITVALLGQRPSDQPDDPLAYRPRRLADDVVAVLDAEGVPSAHLCAYGSSGRVAYAAALAHPDRVSSLIIGGFGEGREDECCSAGADRAWWEAIVEVLRSPESPSSDVSALLGGKRRAGRTDRVLAASVEGVLLCPGPDLDDVATPTLVYVGSRDPVLPAARHDATRIGAPLARLCGRGHFQTFRSVGDVAGLIQIHLQSLAGDRGCRRTPAARDRTHLP